MRILGIDPGMTGAIALLDDEEGNTNVIDMPDTPDGIYTALSLTGKVDWLYIEHQQAFPRQGAVSTGKLLQHYGTLIGIATAMGIPYSTLRPAAWKKQLGLTKQDKDASRLMAIGMFPDLADQMSRKKDHGRAEALLIAHAGRTK